MRFSSSQILENTIKSIMHRALSIYVFNKHVNIAQIMLQVLFWFQQSVGYSIGINITLSNKQHPPLKTVNEYPYNTHMTYNQWWMK